MITRKMKIREFFIIFPVRFRTLRTIHNHFLIGDTFEGGGGVCMSVNRNKPSFKKNIYMFEKSGRVFCWHTVKREPVPIRVLNPKACGVQGRRPDGGCRAAKPPTKKNLIFHFFKNIFFLYKNNFFKLKLSETYVDFLAFSPLRICRPSDMQTPSEVGMGIEWEK